MTMASSQRNVDYILEQIAAAGAVSARRMFGEWGLYCDGRLVALVCDDRLLVKPTEAGRAFIGEVELAQPYPQAKPWYLVAEEQWDERDWLARLIAITAAQLRLPLPKPPRKRKPNK
ncbi:TfoX/Sxy family protein [Rudaea sp.]|uniref:TfoX/Sxy family protein n=1 Tax=Rudaea sp. TaxID=2136325 RepID=UPI0037837D8A